MNSTLPPPPLPVSCLVFTGWSGGHLARGLKGPRPGAPDARNAGRGVSDGRGQKGQKRQRTLERTRDGPRGVDAEGTGPGAAKERRRGEAGGGDEVGTGGVGVGSVWGAWTVRG